MEDMGDSLTKTVSTYGEVHYTPKVFKSLSKIGLIEAILGYLCIRKEGILTFKLSLFLVWWGLVL
jgi:hypothetical protein